jgi:Asp/Glu/hydantoin racemase
VSALSIREDVRAAISNAYYEARNNGRTMEQAADDATAGVLAVIATLADDDALVQVVRNEISAAAVGSLDFATRRTIAAIAAALTERAS